MKGRAKSRQTFPQVLPVAASGESGSEREMKEKE
jgi:hypothetical protein